MHVCSVRQIFTQLWSFGSLGVHSSGARVFPPFSLKTFNLLRSFLSKVLTLSQKPNRISSEDAATQQAHNVSSAFVDPSLLFPGHGSAELTQLQLTQAAIQARACPLRVQN